MSSFTLADLSALGTPDIIETIDYETILANRKAALVAEMAAAGITYDVSGLETDPAIVLLEEASYEEIVLRSRGNDIARQRYLYWAKGLALDHLAAFYDVVRMAGEKDDRLKLRVILAIQGRSTGGTEARYRGEALAADIRVADAKVYTTGLSPVVNVAVFATDNNGTADTTLLQAVSNRLNLSTIKMVNDTLNIVSAVVSVINISGDVKLLPDTASSILSTIETEMPANWIAASGLGRDLTLDWIRSQVVVPGVYGVTITSPSSDVIVSPYTAVRIGTVTLNPVGRAY